MFGKTILLVFGFCWFSVAANAQSKHTTADSLERALASQKNQPEQIKTLFELAKYWSAMDSARALGYARKAIALTPEEDATGRAAGFYHLGYIYQDYDIDRAQKEYSEAINLLQNIQSKEAWLLLSRTWANYAIGFQTKGDGKSYAEIMLNKVVPLTKKSGDLVKLGFDYLNLATAFLNSYDYDKAIDYYQQAVPLLKQKSLENEDLIDAYSNIAASHLFQNQPEAAKPFIDSAKTILNRHPESFLAPLYYRISGTYYVKTRNIAAALKELNKGLTIAEGLHQKYAATQILFEITKAYKTQHNFGAAKQVLLKMYSNAFAMGIPENRRMVLLELAGVDSALGNFKSAYNWMMQFTVLTDSVFTENNHLALSELEKKYNAAEKEKQILTLQNEKKQQQLSAQKGRTLAIILAIALIALGAVLFAGWRLYLNRKKIADQQHKLHQQELKEIEQTSQLKVYDALIQGQEQERHRIARDLHDGLGGMLAGVKLRLSGLLAKHGQNSEEFRGVVNQLDDSVNELRGIAKNMMPQTLVESGLEAALSGLCQSLSSEKVLVDFEGLGLKASIAQTDQITIYRIVQELLNNAIKHSAAKNILVQCSRNGQQFIITVEDDGLGFDPKALPENKGIGLLNIESRVKYLNGTFEIDSVPGKGTTINIEANLDE